MILLVETEDQQQTKANTEEITKLSYTNIYGTSYINIISKICSEIH